MRPRANSASPARLAALAAVLLAWACTDSEWPDRDPVAVDRAPVDTLEFLPPGSRYLLTDSLARVRVGGYRKGYACTRFTAFDLEERPFNDPPGWSARVGLELPSRPSCAAESGPRDSVLLRRFASAEGPVIRLLDSLGNVLDTATLVRGILQSDSLILKAPALSASKGRFVFRDTTLGAQRLFSADSLGPCERLNHADWSRKGDTTTVRYTWVTLDAPADTGSCAGATRLESLAPVPARR